MVKRKNPSEIEKGRPYKKGEDKYLPPHLILFFFSLDPLNLPLCGPLLLLLEFKLKESSRR